MPSSRRGELPQPLHLRRRRARVVGVDRHRLPAKRAALHIAAVDDGGVDPRPLQGPGHAAGDAVRLRAAPRVANDDDRGALGLDRSEPNGRLARPTLPERDARTPHRAPAGRGALGGERGSLDLDLAPLAEGDVEGRGVPAGSGGEVERAPRHRRGIAVPAGPEGDPAAAGQIDLCRAIPARPLGEPRHPAREEERGRPPGVVSRMAATGSEPPNGIQAAASLARAITTVSEGIGDGRAAARPLNARRVSIMVAGVSGRGQWRKGESRGPFSFPGALAGATTSGRSPTGPSGRGCTCARRRRRATRRSSRRGVRSRRSSRTWTRRRRSRPPRGEEVDAAVGGERGCPVVPPRRSLQRPLPFARRGRSRSRRRSRVKAVPGDAPDRACQASLPSAARRRLGERLSAAEP